MQSYDQDGCVLTCTVSQCSYNQSLECHAQEIRVGDDHPTCDTFTTQSKVGMSPQEESVVMTCKVVQCNFNDSQHCGARGITVDHHSEHADCVTFRP